MWAAAGFLAVMVLGAVAGYWRGRYSVAVVVLLAAAALALAGWHFGWFRGDEDNTAGGDAMLLFIAVGLPAGFCAWAGATVRRQVRGSSRR